MQLIITRGSNYLKSNIMVCCQCLFNIKNTDASTAMIKVKTSTFDTKLMNYRKIRICTTIDPFGLAQCFG